MKNFSLLRKIVKIVHFKNHSKITLNSKNKIYLTEDSFAMNMKISLIQKCNYRKLSKRKIINEKCRKYAETINFVTFNTFVIMNNIVSWLKMISGP